MSNETMITILSALLAGLSVVGFLLPILQRTEKQKRYKDLITDRRQALYKEVIESVKTDKDKNQPETSARENVAAFMKVEQLIGTMSRDLRKKLNQAGYRSPNAPLKFMIAKIALPLVFVLLAMLFMSKSEDMKGGLQLLIFAGCAGLGWALPGILVKNQMEKRQQEINQVFPDALDMMLVCVQGGISVEQAIVRISDEIAQQSETLAEELGLLSAELGLLNDRRTAFQDFADRVGSGAAKSFGTALIQAEKYGTSISKAIRVMADEQREIRMAEAERKAAALPPKLTVPMIVFFLPALFIVILGPAGIQAFQ